MRIFLASNEQTRPCTHKSRLGSSGWSMSTMPPIADIRRHIEHVCFVPQADIVVGALLDHLLAGTVRIFTAHSRQWAPMLRRSLELVLVVGAARRERLLGAAKGLVDILLEIILKEGEGP